jgi:hypothetical protein
LFQNSGQFSSPHFSPIFFTEVSKIVTLFQANDQALRHKLANGHVLAALNESRYIGRD